MSISARVSLLLARAELEIADAERGAAGMAAGSIVIVRQGRTVGGGGLPVPPDGGMAVAHGA